VSAPVGVVLAGGAGRRMGGDKALAPLAGRPLLDHVLAALRTVLGEVVVAAKDDTALPPLPAGVAVWRESGEEERHPLLGIREALRRAAGRAVLVAAVDLPLVTPSDLRALLAAGASDRAVLARAAGRPQPLLALYPPAALAVLDAMGASEPATTVALRLDPLLVDLPPGRLLNINDAADLARAEALVSRT